MLHRHENFDSGYSAAMATERELIESTEWPATVASLADQLGEVGIDQGDVLIVHSSMSALGWVAGGAQAVVEALLAAVGVSGTLVMVTQSGQLTNPALWNNPPVPKEWVETIRAELPAYDPAVTPTRGMGQIAECFRNHPQTIRSDHPTLSFAANGPSAVDITSGHQLTPAFGETSPLATLYELDAMVLLLGSSHTNNTSFHLAEHRASWPTKNDCTEGGPVLVDGKRTWVEYRDLEPRDEDFEQIGAAFAVSAEESSGTVGTGKARLSRQRALVDFAVEWMNANRR
ncbi:MAG: AAC(3) family N-acetyltransferase [Acidimicrobiales bacterium]